MTLYETRLRGAKNRILEAASLAKDNETNAKLQALVLVLNELIKAEAPRPSEEVL